MKNIFYKTNGVILAIIALLSLNMISCSDDEDGRAMKRLISLELR